MFGTVADLDRGLMVRPIGPVTNSAQCRPRNCRGAISLEREMTNFAAHPAVRQAWHAVVRSSDVTDRPLPVTLCGEELVVWRARRRRGARRTRSVPTSSGAAVGRHDRRRPPAVPVPRVGVRQRWSLRATSLPPGRTGRCRRAPTWRACTCRSVTASSGWRSTNRRPSCPTCRRTPIPPSGASSSRWNCGAAPPPGWSTTSATSPTSRTSTSARSAPPATRGSRRSTSSSSATGTAGATRSPPPTRATRRR